MKLSLMVSIAATAAHAIDVDSLNRGRNSVDATLRHAPGEIADSEGHR